MAKVITLNEIVELTKQLSLVDKVRLIEEVAPQIEQELKTVRPETSAPSVAGLHAELGAEWMNDDFDEPLPDEFWLGAE